MYVLRINHRIVFTLSPPVFSFTDGSLDTNLEGLEAILIFFPLCCLTGAWAEFF